MILNRVVRLRSKRSKLNRVCFFALLGLSTNLISACADNAGIVSTPVPTRKIRTTRLDALPFETMLPQLHPENRSLLLEFAANTPETLPELAMAWSTFMEPSVPNSEQDSVVELNAGFAEFQLGVANHGSNHIQPNILCLLNGVQVSCTPETDVWEVWAAPMTLAVIPVTIPASPGDLLTFLFLPPDNSKRVFVATGLLLARVERQTASEPNYVEAPSYQQPHFGEDACDFNFLHPDLSPRDSFRIPGIQERGTILYLLIKLCKPLPEDYVYLIPIIDREQVIDLPGEIWHAPVRLAYPTTVIPIDTTLLGSAREFQIAIIPLSEGYLSELDNIFYFTWAVAFPEK